MGARRWEELHPDCLSDIFGRVGMESLVLDIPFVCKSWNRASLNPQCWQFLYFPNFEPQPLFITRDTVQHDGPESFGPFYDKYVEKYQIDKSRFSITAFIKLVVDRSKGKALQLKMPEFSTEDALRYVSDACPNVRILFLPDDLVIFKHSRIIAEVIGKWKLLEHLCLGGNIKKIRSQFILGQHHLSKHFKALLTSEPCHNVENYHQYLDPILVQINEHCKHFTGLLIIDASVEELEAFGIVESLPNLKQLRIIQSYIKRDCLITVLRDCKNLEMLDVRSCEGFDEGDEEISKLASHIKFLSKGSVSPQTENKFDSAYRKLFLLFI